MIDSSPCIRGTQKLFDSNVIELRFIPVHTGNTTPVLSVIERLTVHPRAYGEHPIVPVYGEWSFGSSPCIRGTQRNP